MSHREDQHLRAEAMSKPATRTELVEAVQLAWGIVDDAIPADSDDTESYKQEAVTLRAAAMPVILRELLDCGLAIGEAAISELEKP